MWLRLTSGIKTHNPNTAAFTIVVPKLAVPAGLDAQGRPLGLLLWGRAVPPEQLYNDSFARTFDLRFLYQARALVAGPACGAGASTPTCAARGESVHAGRLNH